MTWENRIVEHRTMNPSELKANAKNWRLHPDAQASGLSAVMGEVGIVQSVVLNLRSQSAGWPDGEEPTIIDGHLRVEQAIKEGVAELPVVVVDLTEKEEDIILATLDPVGAMAGADAAAVKDLLGRLDADSTGIASVVEALLQQHDIKLDDLSGGGTVARNTIKDQLGWVDFRFGDVAGKVHRKVYEAFHAEVLRRTELGEQVMISDLLLNWLDLAVADESA
jgi:hypothetical protein